MLSNLKFSQWQELAHKERKPVEAKPDLAPFMTNQHRRWGGGGGGHCASGEKPKTTGFLTVPEEYALTGCHTYGLSDKNSFIPGFDQANK